MHSSSIDSPLPTTAHSLRSQYRENQAHRARLRLLHEAGRILASGGAAAIAAVLAEALDFSAFEGGAVLLEDAGALLVHASRGEVFPHGTRFPAQGILTTMLQPDARVAIRKKSISRLLLPAGGIAELEILFPLIRQAQPIGVLVLLSRQQLAPPTEHDMLALATLATMLALALSDAPAVGVKKMSAHLQQRSALLTSREREVLALLPHGLTNGDIGKTLGIATGTVKVHVERIIHKMGLQDRTQVAALAVELGLGRSGAAP
jgi:DNA-binding CsgD family transcriptional regulator